MPGTITPQPSPFVHVTAHAQPSASMAEMWVVAPSRPAMNVAPNPGSARAVEEGGRPLPLGGFHGGDERADDGRGRCPVEQREREREEDAAGVGRRVRRHRPPPVGGADGLARDGGVGGEVRARQEPAALAHPVAHGGRDVAGVERRGTVGGEPLERVGERGVAVDVALGRGTPRGHEVRPRLLRALVDRPQDLEQEGLRGVDLDAPAGERDRGRDELGERQPGVALGRAGCARHRAVGARGGGTDVELLHRVAEVDLDRAQRRVRRSGRAPASGRLDEEVEQHRRRARAARS